MESIRHVPASRRAILHAIKLRGSATIAELSTQLEMTGEAVRQQLIQLQKEEWVSTVSQRESDRVHSGRPAAHFRLTVAGEHLFPKRYDRLALALLDAVGRLDGDLVTQVFELVAEQEVRFWEARLAGAGFDERIEAIRDVYCSEHPFAELERMGDGTIHLSERNCPYLNVANSRPGLCNISLHILRKLLGVDVQRLQRMEAGDDRCVFRIDPKKPLGPDVAFPQDPAPMVTPAAL
ncbi:MAG: helix-turn-helix transcriptional regulator [Thermoanaerobaculia bacterium]